MEYLEKLGDHIGKYFKTCIDESPNECLISGLKKCNEYMIANEDQEAEVVYITNPAYNAYTIYRYDKGDLTFTREHYDLDEGCWHDTECLDLYEILDHPRFPEIIAFYGITDEEISAARIE